jgi:hypothetical protein
MQFRMVKEKAGPDSPGDWHMVRRDEDAAMCGRPLCSTGQQLPPEDWGKPEATPFCRRCGSVYLHEVS